jgi:hypothetical protein
MKAEANPSDVRENTLSQALKLSMNAETGITFVGRLSDELTKNLHAMSTADPALERMEYASDLAGDAFNLTPLDERGDHWFHFADVESSDFVDEIEQLSGVVLELKNVPKVGIQFLKCDYMGLHNDLNMVGICHREALVVLLDAPMGCSLVTNDGHRTVMTPGDVVVIDDYLMHGAYPLSRTERVDRAYLMDQPKEVVTAFTDRNCLSFLLICWVVDDSGNLDEVGVPQPFFQPSQDLNNHHDTY